jgi:hypothetical protein
LEAARNGVELRRSTEPRRELTELFSEEKVERMSAGIAKREVFRGF